MKLPEQNFPRTRETLQHRLWFCRAMMNRQLPFVTVLLVISSAAGVTNAGGDMTATPSFTQWTTESPVGNLKGKMFTLSVSGRISLHRPFSSPPTTGYPRSTSPPWTTSQPYQGVSVCLRYMTDFLQSKDATIFTLSPSSRPLTLGVSYGSVYWLSSNRYGYIDLRLQPSVRISSPIRPEVWTAVCVTVDSRRNVAQMFSGSSMSVRKFLPNPYVWSGESEVLFPGFDGQVTDVQVWDYPLRYPQVYNYMTGGAFMPYRGSVIGWSHVAYSLRGMVKLEEAYEWQQKQLLGSRGRRLKEEEKSRRVLNESL